jgi:hypothetical protein
MPCFAAVLHPSSRPNIPILARQHALDLSAGCECRLPGVGRPGGGGDCVPWGKGGGQSQGSAACITGCHEENRTGLRGTHTPTSSHSWPHILTRPSAVSSAGSLLSAAAAAAAAVSFVTLQSSAAGALWRSSPCSLGRPA